VVASDPGLGCSGAGRGVSLLFTSFFFLLEEIKPSLNLANFLRKGIQRNLIGSPKLICGVPLNFEFERLHGPCSGQTN